MRNRRNTLLQQVLIEEKRNQLKLANSDIFNPKKKYSLQLHALLPNINFIPKQIEFIDARQFLKWYLGGYKSGKTFTGVSTDIWLAQVNRPYPGILVHPTMDGNELTILPTIDEICELNKISYEVKRLRTKFKVIFKFGKYLKDFGNLILASGDVPKSLKGPKYAFGHIDEPFIMKKEIVEVIISRLAEARALLRMLLFTGTPEPEHMSWGFDIVDKKYENTKERFLTTVSTRETAKYLAPGYIEEIEKTSSPEWIATFIDGEYRNLSQGKVYHSFDNKVNLMEAAEIERYQEKDDNELVLSFDFNVNQMSAALHRLSGTYKLQIEEFRIQSRSDTSELCILIINRLKVSKYIIEETGFTKYKRSLLITGDAAGKAHSSKSNKSDYEIIIEEFEKAGIKISVYVPDTNPAVRDRINYINMQFQNRTYLISKNCPITIRDRELTSWKLGADGFFIDKSKKELTHLSDAADYGIYHTQMLTITEGGGMGVTVTNRNR